MTSNDELRTLKRIAKSVAREMREKLATVQKRLAVELGYSHWPALVTASASERLATEEQLKKLQAWVAPNSIEYAENLLAGAEIYGPFGMVGNRKGQLDGQNFVLYSALADSIIAGRGWAICVREAASAPPRIKSWDRRLKRNPMTDPVFVKKATDIAAVLATKTRAAIAKDWPRRSSLPDAQGYAIHPIGRMKSKEWHCLHCDGEFNSRQITTNMFHCPECHASPIDIFHFPFWLSAES